MAKISLCFKRTFVFFNSLFAIFGIVSIALGVNTQQYANKVHLKEATDSGQKVDARTEVIALYVTGSIVFCIAVLGAYGAHKESKCTLIVFFIIMCLVTASMSCIAIQLALNHTETRSLIGEYIKQEMMRTEDQKQELSRFQERNHCCGLFNGSRDWRDEVPDSCNCVNKNADDTCETVSSRSVWSKKCGPIFTEYAMVFLMAVLFSLPALAILGGLMSLAMIILVSASPETQLPSFPLSYNPPKYSELFNY